MAAVEALCQSKFKECEEHLRIVYYDHNEDPEYVQRHNEKEPQLSKSQFKELVDLATVNDLSKFTRGNGERQQVICAGIPNTPLNGLSALAEAPMINEFDNKISLKQQLNVGIGFAPGNGATWPYRGKSDHIRREKALKIKDTTFEEEEEMCNDESCNNNKKEKRQKYQELTGEPMKMNLKPDWDCKSKNFLTGSKLCFFFNKILVWCTRSYFEGSMIESLSDPRQITIIVLKGKGVIQCAYGLLMFKPGDMVQIPQHTPFRLFVKKGEICETINYFSKESLVLPDAQLNVNDMNQAPFSPSNVIQCGYFYNESKIIESRSEYLRIEQFDHSYKLYYYANSKNGFNFDNFCHYGPMIHKVNLITDYERIGTSIGHKDPNIWLILRHKFDASFGIAFITGESFILINNINQITYPPAYLHLNGVHEIGELIKFASENECDLSYDARKSTSGEGQSLIHVAGMGHGGDAPIMKQFLLWAILKHIFVGGNRKHNDFLKQLMKIKLDISKNDEKLIYQFINERNNNNNKNEIEKRIEEMIKYIYSIDNNQFKFDETKHQTIEDCIYDNIIKMIKVILNNGDILNEKKLKFLKLGMPFGMGYLLIESRDAPAIPCCNEKRSNFRQSQDISYGMEVGDAVDEANQFLAKLGRSASKL